jgi:hypothetical protein
LLVQDLYRLLIELSLGEEGLHPLQTVELNARHNFPLTDLNAVIFGLVVKRFDKTEGSVGDL